MSFAIRFIGQKADEGEYGEITLGDFSEHFIAPTDYWGMRAYEKQWREAVRRVVDSDSDIDSMLIISMPNLSEADVIESWPLYKVGSNVFVQNSRIDQELLDEKIDEENLYKIIPPRETISKDTGEPISEWKLSLGDLKDWLSSSMENS